MAKSNKKVKFNILLSEKVAESLVWLSLQKDSKGNYRCVSEIIEYALLLFFASLNAKAEFIKDKN